MDTSSRIQPFPFLTVLFAALSLGMPPLSAEDDSPEKNKDEEKKTKTVAELIENCDTLDGLFPLHQDRESGKIFLEISEDQLTTAETQPEFIHFSHTLDGVVGLGLFRGQFSRERVFSLRRHFEKIEFVEQNTSFFFHPDSALRRASEANISEAILATQKIEAMDVENGRFLVEADEIFLKTFFRQLKPGKSNDDQQDRFKLGDLSDERTRFLEAKSFPDNTLFRVQYVFENPQPAKEGEADVTDSRFVTVKVQHTLIDMPKNDYEPRFEDPRVGYFTTQVTDLTSKSSAPYRDLVHRWHLEKKDPEAEKSDPVEPITWWIENTTPVELRETIREAVLAWNPAFESAGITNAIEVKIQPDDAEWDADDIRYHVLRWTSSPEPPFGGYGPSFVNPRTGQILGADIMLEYVFLTNRIRYREIVDLGSVEETAPAAAFQNRLFGHQCRHRECLHSNRIAGSAILRAQAARFGNGPIEMEELISQALTDLILHEIGHTIGLSHNFRASRLYDRKTIHDTEVTAKTGVTASVMDYSPINLALDPEEQGHYYNLVPGPYDHWAVRFGYADSDEREEILAESILPEHQFANDADDMRSAGRGIDPRAMINDLTSEPIEHANDRMQLVRLTLPKLIDQFPVEGESYHEVRTAFSTLMRDYERSVEVLSRYIGGIEVERAFHGQEGAPENPFTPVAAETQSRAMDLIAKNLFAPGAIEFPVDLLAHLQLKRRGFEFFELDGGEDPKIHERVLDIQEDVLDQLLHEHTLARILDSSLYGNEYSLETMMTALDDAIMKGDPEGVADSFREPLQVEYIHRLIEVSGLESDSKHPFAARGQAIVLLEKHLEGNDLPGPERHTRHLERLIKNALEGE